MRFVSSIFVSASVCSAFGGRSSFGIEESHRHGLADPATYEGAVFKAPESYSSNLLEKGSFVQTAVEKVDFAAPVRDALRQVQRQMGSQPASFVQLYGQDGTKWSNMFRPYSLEEAKAASVKLAADKEKLADRQSIMRSKLEILKTELQSQIDSARKEKQSAEDRMAKRGMGPSSFVQNGKGSSFVQNGKGISPDSSLVQTSVASRDIATRELEKINEMQRSWKLAADRLAHAELASAEPNAKLIDANSKVEADRKRINRLQTLINEDMERVEKDASIVAAQQDQMKKAKADRDFKADRSIVV